MRIAVFSDVHGNLSGLEAVLADIAAQEEGFDEIVFAGDLCVFGPRPDGCVELLRRHEPAISTIYGNTDQWISGLPLLAQDADAEERLRWERIGNIVDWTREIVPPMNRAWLDSLPFQRRISPTVNPRDDLFIVHANPHNVDDVIYPDTALQKELFGEVRQEDGDLEKLVGGLVFAVLAFGHLHVPSVRRWREIRLVNVASVSRPGDGDRRAKYVIFTWDGEHWGVEHRYVEYDLGPEIAAYEERQPPGWEGEVATLRQP
jgi:predicted phosphodiesterase